MSLIESPHEGTLRQAEEDSNIDLSLSGLLQSTPECDHSGRRDLKNAIMISASTALLVACGGGGSGGSGQSVSVDATPIKLFSDGSGVGRVELNDGEEVTTGYILAPELATVLSELRRTKQITPFNYNSLPFVASGPNTSIRQGAVTVDGNVVNVTTAVTNSQDAALTLLEDPRTGISFLISEGRRATGVPLSGTATYAGIFGMQDVYFDDAPELGTFTATANFQNRTVNFNGNTASYGASGTATISGNRFSSGTMLIEDRPFGIVESGSMQGDFHGDGGRSMAGVIYSNDSRADYRGGFVGSR